MEHVGSFSCRICGSKKISAEDEWFLVCESRWQDRLKILRWHDQLAGQEGLNCACSAAHVQELVVHWMTTGSLEYPFAYASPHEPRHSRLASTVIKVRDVDTSAAQQVGELSVHRESIRRVLAESPHSLTTIMDALLRALDRNKRIPTEVETEGAALCLAGG